jgi:hypothetical protein
MIPLTTEYLKPRTWTKYLFLVTPAIFFTLYYTQEPKEETFLYVALGSLVFFFVFAWLISKVHVVIDNDSISYKTAFTTKTMDWRDVTRTYFKIRHTGKSTVRMWCFENTSGKTLSFSTNMYSRASMQTIAEAVVAKCSKADIEDKIRDIATGKFPWYIF